jgi:methylmalonyl-CoA/ethylmalonyl-CoA epimerase
MPELRFDHIALLVDDLDESVRKWRAILEILDPEQAKEVVYGEGEENGERMRWATFVKPGGTAIQLFAPAGEGGFLRKILSKRGEIVHHLAFLSSDVDRTVGELREGGFPILQEHQTAPDSYPWLRWNFVRGDWSGGVLIEVAQRYRVLDGRWAPVEGDPS